MASSSGLAHTILISYANEGDDGSFMRFKKYHVDTGTLSQEIQIPVPPGLGITYKSPLSMIYNEATGEDLIQAFLLSNVSNEPNYFEGNIFTFQLDGQLTALNPYNVNQATIGLDYPKQAMYSQLWSNPTAIFSETDGVPYVAIGTNDLTISNGPQSQISIFKQVKQDSQAASPEATSPVSPTSTTPSWMAWTLDQTDQPSPFTMGGPVTIANNSSTSGVFIASMTPQSQLCLNATTSGDLSNPSNTWPTQTSGLFGSISQPFVTPLIYVPSNTNSKPRLFLFAQQHEPVAPVSFLELHKDGTLDVPPGQTTLNLSVQLLDIFLVDQDSSVLGNPVAAVAVSNRIFVFFVQLHYNTAYTGGIVMAHFNMDDDGNIKNDGAWETLTLISEAGSDPNTAIPACFPSALVLDNSFFQS